MDKRKKPRQELSDIAKQLEAVPAEYQAKLYAQLEVERRAKSGKSKKRWSPVLSGSFEGGKR
ncbi:hypothetical protein [Pseudomonas sp. GV071]|uniref:hypothetical protein n=1 Tax=Pseudomonas sp. GV071 TaxID=2135754 RepID=UPI000D34149C|nr:hypothetical protein [Pseudomonas sp. GV071]